ncbi:glycosyltransferase family 2 protein [Nubsella zeaxanthinifaciens]|uniref:glycosyltransferase family 2 protein n=1 Tax=Nubsella zeaxanthinifaciens TaxID=392412 RepID=UPI000DE45635|nr:glycosyltransferase family 2 protein [Nubsella zeaxanthinifaciens]
MIVVIPAYNAAKTIEDTYHTIPPGFVDEIILVDDFSNDATFEIAKDNLLIKNCIKLDKNVGYGGNQKKCYQMALALKADIILMLHGDYQYDPRLIPAMVSMIAYDVYDVVLGSRIIGNRTIVGKMPRYKYVSNRILTAFQNLMLNTKLSEYHTGLRAYKSSCLEAIPFEKNSDNFIFDNQILLQLINKKFHIGEVSCPIKYFKEASSISFKNSLVYGIGILRITFTYLMHRWGVRKEKIFS